MQEVTGSQRVAPGPAVPARPGRRQGLGAYPRPSGSEAGRTRPPDAGQSWGNAALRVCSFVVSDIKGELARLPFCLGCQPRPSVQLRNVGTDTETHRVRLGPDLCAACLLYPAGDVFKNWVCP